MTYTSFLVHVENGSTSSDARIELAAGLTSRFDALLLGVAAGAPVPVPVDASGMGVVADIYTEEEASLKEELAAAEDRFRTVTGPHEIRTEWRSAIDMPTSVLAREARSADLVIVGRDLARLSMGVYRSADPGDVLMTAGRPVLVVPPGSSALRADSIVVAWKDTREARRAVWDALPLLKKAASVKLLEVAEEAELELAAVRVDRVATYLQRHSVKAEVEVRTRRERSDADELILVAEQHGADLIVAGGYGHARFREWVFGGVTHDLLRHSPKCCLLSH
jgi:nucleotide-binding universal stress UspA family protein